MVRVWHTIIDVIKMGMWVSWITHNKRAPQPVAILVQKVTVIPECALNHGYREFTTQSSLWDVPPALEP